MESPPLFFGVGFYLVALVVAGWVGREGTKSRSWLHGWCAALGKLRYCVHSVISCLATVTNQQPVFGQGHAVGRTEGRVGGTCRRDMQQDIL